MPDTTPSNSPGDADGRSPEATGPDQNASPSKPKRPRRRRSWRRRIYFYAMKLFIVVVLVLFTAHHYFSQPERVAGFAEQILTDLTGGDASVRAGRFTYDGIIRLYDVRLTVPTSHDEPAELFAAEEVVVELDPYKVITGDVTPTSITLNRPVVSVVEMSQNRFNVEKLRPPPSEQDKGMGDLPRVIIRDAWLVRGEVLEDGYHFLNRMNVEGELTHDANRGNTYSFSLRELAASDTLMTTSRRHVDPLEFTGVIDMARGRVDGELKRMGLDGPHASLLPRQLREWWQRLEPSGAIGHVKFRWAGGREPAAEVALDNVELTLPIPSEAGEYRTRMTNVSGSFRFNFDGIHPDLVGRIEGLKYHVFGTIKGYNAEAPFDLSLQTAPFRIPEEPRYMVALPIEVQRAFKMLNPVGWLKVSLSMRRNTPGGSIDPSGTATILTGRQLHAELRRDDPAAAKKYTPNSPELVSSGMYHEFPYKFTNARGLITFDTEGVYVKNITGDTPNGGSATITGEVSPLTADAAIELTVAAVNIPFDDVLFEALPKEEADGLAQFFYAPGWRRLHQLGHYQTASEHAALKSQRDQLRAKLDNAKDLQPGEVAGIRRTVEDLERKMKVPVYELGGTGNVIVTVTRPPGVDKFRIDCAIDLLDANMVVEYFPYPVRIRKGRIVLTREKFTFDALTFDGLNGGSGGLVGWVDRHYGTDKPIEPHLMFTYMNGPVDQLLFDVLGDPADKWIAELHPRGEIDIEGRIFRKPGVDTYPGENIDIDMKVDVDGMSITPGGGKFTLSEIKGHLDLTRRSVGFKGLEARREDARVDLSGDIAWGRDIEPSVRLKAAAYDLEFEDPVLDLVSTAVDSGDAVRDFWAEHQPTGRFDAEVDYTVAGDKPRDYKLRVKPEDLSFIYEGARINLAGTSGTITVEPNKVTLDKFAGRFDNGQMEVSGPVRMDPFEAKVSLKANGPQISPTVRHVLPKSLVKVMDAMGLVCGYDVTMPMFYYRPGATDGPRSEIKATVKLADTACQVGLPITRMNGTMQVHATTMPDLEWPKLRMELAADALYASGRRVENVKMRMLNVDGQDRLIIPQLEGRVADGRIGGIGALELDNGAYQVQLELVDADLVKLTVSDDDAKTQAADAAGRRPVNIPVPKSSGKTPELKGEVSASFDITGSWADAKVPVLGRGDLIVRNASLTGVPLSMGLLKITHLTLPSKDRFNRALLSFYLRKDGVHFENIALMAPEMTISGRGAMTADGRLALTLTTSNPKRLQLGPLSDLIDGVRNELATIQITGTLDKPKTTVRQFDGVRRAWIDVFGGNSKKK